MSFLYVDRIMSFESGKAIHGQKLVTRSENLFYWLPSGERVLSPAAVTEALGQLVALLAGKSRDFSQRPVLLADECTSYHGFVRAGDVVDLHAEITQFDDGEDVIVNKSYATVNGQKVIRVDCGRGYMLPVEDFCPSEDWRRQFERLVENGKKGPIQPCDFKPLPPYAGRQSFEALRFIDGIQEHVPHQKVVGVKNFTSSESYFAEHFPRRKVVPGVILLTFMGEICQYLIKEKLDGPLRSRALIPMFIQKARFRKFVEPGDQCTLTAEVIQGDSTKPGNEILVKATIVSNSQRVMAAEMGFLVTHGTVPLSWDELSWQFIKRKQ
jgi:3-hydroxymyristoyl/3-hydroxydecanoyl-(acyl carrier protein) dehydratase